MTIQSEVEKIKKNIEKRGYFLNPDASMTDALVEALLINEKRYGYPFCPCRLASGTYIKDIELICPCDYRDQDINEFNACFCGLYVSKEVTMAKATVEPIPERHGEKPDTNKTWRCKVCGYISVRPHAPNICPICGVAHDRFEEYTLP